MIGRQVAAAWVAQAFGEAPVSMAAGDAFAAVLTKGDTLHLTDAMSLRRSLVMGVQRIELVGFTSAMVARLKAIGLTSEIIAWKLRLFIPTGSNGPSITARLLSRHPIERIAPRVATRHAAA